MRWLRAKLSAPTDVASLAVWRVLFGLLICISCAWLSIAGWTTEYVDALGRYRFAWPGLEWIAFPKSAGAVRGLAAMTAVAGLGMAVAWHYRLCASIVAGFLMYAIAADQFNYSSTLYLMALVAVLMVFAPVQGIWSYDVRRGRTKRQDTGPACVLFAVRFQMALVYVYAAICKLTDPDWLINAGALKVWMHKFEGGLLGGDGMPFAFAWAGFLFDLLIVPGLLVPRTRAITFGLAVAFHLFNAVFFDVFPLPVVAIGLTSLFLDPKWPRQFIERFRGKQCVAAPRSANADKLISIPLFLCIIVWSAAQVGVPMRQYLVDGNIAWHSQGERFAWRLRIRSKSAKVRFRVTQLDTGKRWWLDVKGQMMPRQLTFVGMNPDHIVLFARQIAQELREEGVGEVAIHVRGFQRLNGFQYRRFIDSSVDLSRVQRPTRYAKPPWVHPWPHGTTDIKAPD